MCYIGHCVQGKVVKILSKPGSD